MENVTNQYPPAPATTAISAAQSPVSISLSPLHGSDSNPASLCLRSNSANRKSDSHKTADPIFWGRSTGGNNQGDKDDPN